MKTRRFWTPEELSLVRELYPVRATREVAAILQRSERSIYEAASKLGITKSASFLDSPESGRLRKGETRPGCVATQFRPGHAPANKGLRRPGWAPGRMGETQFQKGTRSGIAARNWMPIGTVRVDDEGYQRIKVREAVHGVEATGFGNSKVWPLLQRHVWAECYGPIPENHVIAFKDRDRTNCAIENLECVSRAEMAYRNRMWGRLPQELAEAIQMNGVLKRKLRRLGGEEQNV